MLREGLKNMLWGSGDQQRNPAKGKFPGAGKDQLLLKEWYVTLNVHLHFSGDRFPIYFSSFGSNGGHQTLPFVLFVPSI